MKVISTWALVLGLSILAAPLALHAQTDPGGLPETTPTPLQQGGRPVPNNQTTPGVVRPNLPGGDTSLGGGIDSDAQGIRDKLFLRKAAQASLAEIQLGQLAEQKASSEEVKQFAQKMVASHTRLHAALQPFGDSLGVRAPTKPGKNDQLEYEKLSALQGLNFDKEYLAYASQDHHQGMRDFREEAEATSDPNLKEAVTRGLAMMARHSYLADKLASGNGVAVNGDNR